MAFTKLPKSADPTAIQPYTINFADGEIHRMRQLIELSNIPEPCFENSQSDGSRQYGIQRDWLLEMRSRWLDKFEWKTHEARLNAYPHFKANVVDRSVQFDIHFVALFSTHSDAIPLVFFHGWPGSFLEFIPMLDLIRKQYENDASKVPYHIIVPSLPGFGLSSGPPINQSEELFSVESVARIFDNLMGIIFGPSTKYVAQGGDIGSRVAKVLVSQYSNCIASHLNYDSAPEPASGPENGGVQIEDVERQAFKRAEWFKSQGAAYALEQATRPSTIGLVLSSNPVALLAWVGEKFLDWTDPASFPSQPPHSSPQSDFAEDILLSVSLYWLSGHIATTFYSYKFAFGKNAKPHWSYPVAKPKMLGHSWFPQELAPVPVSWLQANSNLVWWRRHEIGGHFAALEGPEKLWKDVQDFLEVVNKNVQARVSE